MSQYAILIYEDEASSANAGQETFDQLFKGHRAFVENNASVLRDTNALQPTDTATSVRKDSSGGFAVSGAVRRRRGAPCDGVRLTDRFVAADPSIAAAVA
jgi:hypothetical protein